MKETWNEILYIDCLVGDEWTAFIVGTREEAEKYCKEIEENEYKMICKVIDSFEVE